MNCPYENRQQSLKCLWPDDRFGKRKFSDEDFDIESKRKHFLSEDQLIKDLKYLSLNKSIEFHPTLEKYFKSSMFDQTEPMIVKENLSTQLVPFMPIHSAQLMRSKEKSDEQIETKNSPPANDNHLLKRPNPVPCYTVEEPCETTVKHSNRMKRSYSQSLRTNSNLSVIELKNDSDDFSSDYATNNSIISEPNTPCQLESTEKNRSTVTGSSIQIIECFDFSPSTDDRSDSLLVDASDIQPMMLSEADHRANQRISE